MDTDAHKKRFNQLCHQVFGTPEGQELMKYLEEIMRAPVAMPEKNANFAYWREGENNIIRLFRAASHLHTTASRGENDTGSTSTESD